MGSSSPQSQELQNFEAYNRRVLPQLVEASLSAAISNDLAPLEERVRSIVGDIIRTCQSTVFQNFQRLNTSGSPRPGLVVNPPASMLRPIIGAEGNDTSTHIGSSTPSTSRFYQEPPHLNSDRTFASFETLRNYDSPQQRNNQSSDSGYGSITRGCQCACHKCSDSPSDQSYARDAIEMDKPANEVQPSFQGCFFCAHDHPDELPSIDNSGKDDDPFKDFDFEQYLQSGSGS